jgi:serine O-acetyltransferase
LSAGGGAQGGPAAGQTESPRDRTPPAYPTRRRRTMLAPERLWLLSIALHRRGHRTLARFVKNVNSAYYHNSLPPQVTLSPDVRLEHHGFGTVIHSNVVIGRRVRIYQNVTIAMRAGAKSPHRIYIEDDVLIGANAVVISSHHQDLRIGRGARIGAGAVVSADVPPGCSVVSAAAQVIWPDGRRAPLSRGGGAAGQ